MKKLFLLFITLIFGITLVGCQNTETSDIVTTMYTHYSFAKEIVEDKLTVDMLIPIGEEIHGYEASSQDMVKIKESKIFVFTSLEIDTWISNPDTIGGDETIVLNMEEVIGAHDHEAELSYPLSDDHDHDHSEEIHYWVDPMNAIEMIEHLLEAIISIDPDNTSFYTDNAETLISEIETLSNDFTAYLNTLTTIPNIYVGGHNAFSVLGDHFGFEFISIFGEYEPDAELTSAEMIAFMDEIINAGTHYIFIEALESDNAAKAIKAELLNQHQYELTILKLSAYQNVSLTDYNKSLTYSDIMEQNLENLKIALGA